MNGKGHSVHADYCRDAASAEPDRFAFEAVIDEICRLRWEVLTAAELMQIAKAYYYFSIQFRENLEIACRLHPADPQLQRLREGECDTDNLSPWPGVTEIREKLDHDEFMRRLLAFQTIARDDELSGVGQSYLALARSLDDAVRAASIASYEDGGLTRVFNAILRVTEWRGAGPGAFKFFLEQHIRFDSDDGEGHGALARHLTPDDRILPLWAAFRDMLAVAAPALLPEGSRVAGRLIADAAD
ncbi:MAG TPA: hypothetical protein VND87_11185 [Stellaceae bacterium]|nr:hypothetical protein [Stellaceae bacterium]